MNGYTHRRGSIFWALTLIAVGSLFLYHNFDPSIRPWHLIAKFWPVLIIFWGLSKLID
jgi:LiaI-LiaF-like transmembrane region